MSKFILVASDVHHDSQAFEELSKIAGSPDCIAFVYAGDLDVEDWIISDILRKRNFVFIPVAGNCDRAFSFTDAGLAPPPLFRTAEICGLRIFATHGHYYSKPEDAGLKSSDFDIVITGHTHIPSLKSENNVAYINPGSASLPRGFSKPGYCIIKISEESALIENRILYSKETVSSLSVILHK